MPIVMACPAFRELTMVETARISIERVYNTPVDNSCARLLVDGIWPRGVSKDELSIDAWIKNVAPSANLRKWFDHDREKWGEFRNRYFHELADNRDAVGECLDWRRKGPVILLYAAKDRDHIQAVVLREYLTQRLTNTEV
ncbi:DUF488 domain-containing protein [Pseudooceanicola nitratireducens]|uniref:DUF488 domain-containing protein n=1 Tax=Pseudooceanicola nitratireducens TaxID=517719 RepID=UPI0021BC15E5|nr:DUF488 family protein [Pseudooceanicola nitratireducens]